MIHTRDDILTTDVYEPAPGITESTVCIEGEPGFGVLISVGSEYFTIPQAMYLAEVLFAVIPAAQKISGGAA